MLGYTDYSTALRPAPTDTIANVSDTSVNYSSQSVFLQLLLRGRMGATVDVVDDDGDEPTGDDL